MPLNTTRDNSFKIFVNDALAFFFLNRTDKIVCYVPIIYSGDRVFNCQRFNILELPTAQPRFFGRSLSRPCFEVQRPTSFMALFMLSIYLCLFVYSLLLWINHLVLALKGRLCPQYLSSSEKKESI